MKAIKIFENAKFGQIRTLVSESGEPLFCLADLCKILGLGNPSQVKTTLRKDGVISNEVSTRIISNGLDTGKTKQRFAIFRNRCADLPELGILKNFN